MPFTQGSLLKTIRRVDEQFKRPIWIWIRVYLARIILSATGLFAVGIAYFLSRIGAEAATANLLELSLALDANASAVGALGIALFTLTLGRDWQDSERRITERLHFKKLKSEENKLVLRSLIRIKTRLPKEVTLEQVYNANREMFTEPELARMLTERP